MAVHTLGFSLPAEVEWWRIMGADLKSIIDIADEIVELYEMPKVCHICCEREYFLRNSILSAHVATSIVRRFPLFSRGMLEVR